MKEIAVLLPTYKRSHKLRAFIKQFNKVSTRATLYFLISPDDKDTLSELEKLSQNYSVIKGGYVACVNYGFNSTKEPFVVFGADDNEFMPNWDRKLLSLADKYPDKHIFGGTDSWTISQTLKHISHPMLRRSFFKEAPYTKFEYRHYMPDIELIQSNYDIVHIEPKTFIEHHHKTDDTTKHIQKISTKDKDIYLRRRAMFELWDTFAMHDGLLAPTMLNPQYHDKRLYIVVPSYLDLSLIHI